jgi:flagellar biosynthetic protein FlhB
MNLDRLNPAQRLSGVFHGNASAFIQAVILLPLFGYVFYRMSSASFGELLQMPRMGITEAIAAARSSALTLLWQAAVVLLAFGVASYGRETLRYSKKLRMSKQEVRDEAKETEGNPLIKGRVRRLQRDIRHRRVLLDVPKATAVVVNPTHYSVAIRYEVGVMRAPVVVAKGKNLVAQRIRQIAVTHGVAIVENAPLARGLYASAEVGQEIPPHFYRAVAEVLSLLLRLTRKATS